MKTKITKNDILFTEREHLEYLSKEDLISLAEKRFGIPSAKHKTKRELRELVAIAINHEMSMKVISEMASI